MYLPHGGFGNSVVRLASNLQHRFDAILSFADSELQAALKGISQTPDAGGMTSGTLALPDAAPPHSQLPLVLQISGVSGRSRNQRLRGSTVGDAVCTSMEEMGGLEAS